MRILFDANPLAKAKSGVGYYTYQLVVALAKNFPDDLELHGHYFDFLGRKKKVDLPQAPNIHYHTTKLLPGKVFSVLKRKLKIDIPIDLLARLKADIILFPNFAMTPSLFHAPRIVAIHDIYFTRHPEHINGKNLAFLRQVVPRAVKQADHILAISEFTESELMDVFGVPRDRMLVTSIPLQDSMKVPTTAARQAIKKFGIESKYFLFLATLEPRKNVVALIEAYRLLDEELRKKYSLVLAGGKGWNDEDILTAIGEADRDGLNVITTGYISDEEKRALYSVAAAVVVPSHYEGFGMQLLEAMSAEVPVIASDIPVFHEVADEACLYIDPLDVDSIAAAMTTVIKDEGLRSQLVEKGNARLGAYNWDNVAKKVYRVFGELVRG